MILALLAILLGASPAAAQQLPLTIPDHTVIGRVGTGTGSGPTQAVTFAVLSTQLLSGNSGIVISTPPNTTSQALNITQSGPLSGTVTGPLDYNVINITHQSGVTGAAGTTQADGLHLKMAVGGANLSGQPVIGGYFDVQEVISGDTSVTDKIGAVGSCLVIVSDVAGGGCYGLNSVSTLALGASVNRLVGHEADVTICSTCLATYRYAQSFVNTGVGQGGTLDAAMFVGNIGGAGGAFKTMISLSNSLGFAPLTTTADLFSADAATTVANIFNMPNVAVTGSILKFPNATLTGNGLLTLPDVVVTGGPGTIVTGQGTIGASAAGGLVVQGFGSSFDISFNNNAGTNICAVATGTRTLNCNTVTLTNPLAFASGGTGLAGGTSGGLLYFSGTTTLASSAVITANALVLGGGAGVAPTALGSLGTTTTVLHGNAAGAPTFAAVSLTADVSGTLGAGSGGTGNNVYAIGDLLQASTTSALSRLAAVATGNVLISGGVGTISSWGKVGLTTHVTGTLAATNGGTGVAAYTLGDTLFSSATNTLSALAGNITGTRKFLRQTGTGSVSAAPVWDTVLAADVPGSALTKTDDTNVTATLGGSPTTALLNAASITLGWTGTLSVARGGTGDAGTAWASYTPAVTCGTATFTTNSATFKVLGKTTWLNLDFTITALGTCTHPVTFTLPNTAAAGGAISGQEIINRSSVTTCMVSTASTSSTCFQNANVNYALNDRLVVSGVYTNQ